MVNKLKPSQFHTSKNVNEHENLLSNQKANQTRSLPSASKSKIVSNQFRC